MVFVNKTILFFLGIITMTAAVTVVTPPTDVVAKVGDNVTLQCVTDVPLSGTDDVLTWFEFISNPTGYPIFRTSKPNDIHRPGKYQIEGRYNLRVNGVILADGGRYACETYGADPKYEAQIVVIDAPVLMNFTDLYENNMTEFRCSADYAADLAIESNPNLKPMIEMRIDGNIEHLPIYPSIEPALTAGVLPKRSLTAAVNVTLSERHFEKILTCSVYTMDPPFNQTTTLKLDVKYAPRNIRLNVGEKRRFRLDEKITCTANANPPPMINWEKLEPVPSPLPGATLTLDVSMLNVRNKYRCTAKNDLGKVSTSTVDFEVYSGVAALRWAVSTLVAVLLTTICLQ